MKETESKEKLKNAQKNFEEIKKKLSPYEKRIVKKGTPIKENWISYDYNY
jgi:phage-related minor tail protein